MTATSETPDRPRLGVQVAPWAPAADILAATERLAKAFDVVWVPDQMLARNHWVLLSAIAAAGHIGVASGISVPLSRNPVDLASAMATLAEIVPAERPLLMGVGAGGSLVSGLFDKRGVTDLLAESVRLIRALWSGAAVPVGDYPEVTRRLGWRTDGTIRLTYPLARPIPVLVAVGGPRTLAMTEELADGLLCTSTYPPLSYPALRAGGGAALSDIMAMAARRERAGRPVRLVYGLNVCVGRDRAGARAFARRQAALSVGNPALWGTLAEAGADVDAESVNAVRSALRRGGVVEAVRYVSDALLDGLIVAGDAEDCAVRLADAARLARRAGFTEFYLGAPVGPDLTEAADLLVEVVAGAVASELD
jgi:alkanesulfonate monooxygenase SsuD/methylene tetrahydromethanopterin reductase-like flavin-dependent oxidoreductase (luciferase family)